MFQLAVASSNMKRSNLRHDTRVRCREVPVEITVLSFFHKGTCNFKLNMQKICIQEQELIFI